MTFKRILSLLLIFFLLLTDASFAKASRVFQPSHANLSPYVQNGLTLDASEDPVYEPDSLDKSIDSMKRVLVYGSLIFFLIWFYLRSYNPIGEALTQLSDELFVTGILFTFSVLGGSFLYRMTKKTWDYESQKALALLALLAAFLFSWTAIFPNMIIQQSGAGFYMLVLYPSAIFLISYVYTVLAGTTKRLWVPFRDELRVVKAFKQKKNYALLFLLLGILASQPIGAPLMYYAFSMNPAVDPVEWMIILQISIIMPMLLERLRGEKVSKATWFGMTLVVGSVILAALAGADPTALGEGFQLKLSLGVALLAAFSYGLNRFFINLAFSRASHPDQSQATVTIGYWLGIAAVSLYVFVLRILGPQAGFVDWESLFASGFFNAVAFSSAWLVMLYVIKTYAKKKAESIETGEKFSFGLPLLLTFIALQPVMTTVVKSFLLKVVPSQEIVIANVIGVLGIIVAYFKFNVFKSFRAIKDQGVKKIFSPTKTIVSPAKFSESNSLINPAFHRAA